MSNRQDWKDGPDELSPGVKVEVTGIVLAADPHRLRAFLALGRKRPAGSVSGIDYFGVAPGERARVLSSEGDAIRVEILSGRWTGREGWVSREDLRLPPDEAASTADVRDGLSLLTRRQIYAAMFAAGMRASTLAGERYPFNQMPKEAAAAREFLEARRAIYENAKAEGRQEVMDRYGVGADQLDAIDREGMEESWPLWDGLADEQGPIPAYGPADTAPGGRILMTDEEREGRREAAIRALDVVGRITDESDTDEVWDQVSRGLEGAR